MSSINKVILVGNLGAAPEVRHFPTGGQIANVRLATSEYWKDRVTGEKREQTEWHRIAIFGRLAEFAGAYLTKGSQVYVEGRIRTRKWQAQDGEYKYTTEIVADELQLLGKRENQPEANTLMSPTDKAHRDLAPADAFDMEDIPF